MSESIKLTYNVPGDDFTRAGEASSDVKGVLKKLGLSPVVVRKVAIAMYEGEINMVIHGGGGQIAVEIGGEAVSYTHLAPANAVTCRHYAGLNRVFMPGSRDRFDNSSYDSPAKMDRQVISDIAG